MIKLISQVLIAAFFVSISSLAFTAEEPSVELGKKLFNNPGLGASQNAISCNVCHPDGEGLQKAGENPKLAAMINNCIVGPLKGEALNEDTPAMQSLILYIRSLAQ